MSDAFYAAYPGGKIQFLGYKIWPCSQTDARCKNNQFPKEL